MHGGRISAASLPTGGLEICVRLPAAHHGAVLARGPHAGHGIREKELMRKHNMTVETIDTFILKLAFGVTSIALLVLFLLIVIGFSTLSFAQN